MKGSSEKERLLKIIRNSLIEKADIPYPEIDMSKDIYTSTNDDPVMVFAEKIVSFNGKFIYSHNQDEMADKISSLSEYRNWDKIICFAEEFEKVLFEKNIKFNNLEQGQEAEVAIIKLDHVSSESNILTIVSNIYKDNKFSNLPQIIIFISYTKDITPHLKLERYEEITPEFIMMINPKNLLEEELKELYFFAIENMI